MSRLFIIGALFFLSCLGYAQHKDYVYFPDNVDAPLTSKERAQISTVYGDFAETIFSNPTLLKNFKDILRNRVVLQKIDLNKYYREPTFQKIPELSSVPLYAEGNGSLQADTVIDEDTFNPLKYQLAFFPQEALIYRQGDYLIKILPQKKQGK